MIDDHAVPNRTGCDHWERWGTIRRRKALAHSRDRKVSAHSRDRKISAHSRDRKVSAYSPDRKAAAGRRDVWASWRLVQSPHGMVR